MARPGIDPTHAVEDADLLDQHTPAAPEPLTGNPGMATADLPVADEADLLDQANMLPDDDAEDYPNAHDADRPDA